MSEVTFHRSALTGATLTLTVEELVILAIFLGRSSSGEILNADGPFYGLYTELKKELPGFAEGVPDNIKKYCAMVQEEQLPYNRKTIIQLWRQNL